MENIKKSAKDVKRNFIKRKLTGNLGPVEELDDKLICYVKEKKFGTDPRGIYYYCGGIQKKDKDLAESYGLNKPLYYVFNGLEFNKNAVISVTNDSNAVFLNCSFMGNIDITVNGKCFIDNPYLNLTSNLSIIAYELAILSMNDSNTYFSGPSNKYVCITTHNLYIEDSTIGTHSINTSLHADEEINLNNSKIMGNKIDIFATKLTADKKSSFVAYKKINIDVEVNSKIKINTPDITINGKKHSGGKVFKKGVRRREYEQAVRLHK